MTIARRPSMASPLPAEGYVVTDEEFESLQNFDWTSVSGDILADLEFISKLPVTPVLDYEALGPLLPAREADQPDKTLFIDLDETLVHTALGEVGEDAARSHDLSFVSDADGSVQARVYFRPWALDFLRIVSQYYELVLYTASVKLYADIIVDELDVERKIQHRLYREHCTQYGESEIYFKDLHGTGRPLSHSVVIDNRLISFGLNVSNGIFVSSFTGQQNDTELLHLIPILVALAKQPDVRQALAETYKLPTIVERYQQDLNPDVARSLNNIGSPRAHRVNTQSGAVHTQAVCAIGDLSASDDGTPSPEDSPLKRASSSEEEDDSDDFPEQQRHVATPDENRRPVPTLIEEEPRHDDDLHHRPYLINEHSSADEPRHYEPAEPRRSPDPTKRPPTPPANLRTAPEQQPGAGRPRADERPPRTDERPSRADERPPRADARPPRADARPPRADDRPPRADDRPTRADDRPTRAGERPPTPIRDARRSPPAAEVRRPIISADRPIAPPLDRRPSSDMKPTTDEPTRRPITDSRTPFPDETLPRRPLVQAAGPPPKDQYLSIQAPSARFKPATTPSVPLVKYSPTLSGSPTIINSLGRKTQDYRPVYEAEEERRPSGSRHLNALQRISYTRESVDTPKHLARLQHVEREPSLRRLTLSPYPPCRKRRQSNPFKTKQLLSSFSRIAVTVDRRPIAPRNLYQ